MSDGLAKVLVSFGVGVALGIAVSSLIFSVAMTHALDVHVRDTHAVDRIDDSSIEPPACGVIYRVEQTERVPVATIGHCEPTNSTEAPA